MCKDIALFCDQHLGGKMILKCPTRENALCSKNDGKLYERTLSIYLSLPESSENDFRKLIEPTDGALECGISAKLQQILDNAATSKRGECIELLFLFASGLSERGYKSICKLELILSKEIEYDPKMP